MNKHSLHLLAVIGAIVALLTSSSFAQTFVFDWGDFNSPISNVEAGDSFTLSDVDGSGVDFTFTFSQALDSRTGSTFETIVNPNNPSSDFPNNFTGNTNFEGLYTTNPLYLVGKSDWTNDLLILDITTSAPIIFDSLIIGDIDRFDTGNGNDSQMINSFEDRVTITSFLGLDSVDVDLTTISGTIAIDNVANFAEATSGGPLDSALTDSQITVSTLGAADRLRIIYQNADAIGNGLADTNDGWSNSHWITLGTDTQLTQFEVVPEPGSNILAAIAGLLFLARRRRHLN